MKGVHTLLAAALLALATPADPAVANKVIIPNNGSESFAELVQIFRTSAMHQPTFNTKHRCSLAHECATVEFAVREKGDGADFFIYPDSAPQDVIWCTTSEGHSNVRYCEKAGSEPRTIITWFEAGFPLAGEYREIPYGNGANDPDCKGFQHSQYDIDEDYVTCVVHKFDAPPPSTVK